MEASEQNIRGAAEARGHHRQLDARAAGASPRVEAVGAASSRVHVRRVAGSGDGEPESGRGEGRGDARGDHRQ